MGKHYSQEDFQEIPLKNIVAEQLAADPGTPQNGRLWLNTVANKIKTRLNGVTRILVDDGDTRLTDSRAPSGPAGGDLAGTYPNPTIGSNKVLLSHLALSLIESGVSSGTAAAGAAALRALGFGANDALAGTTRLDQIAVPTTTVNMNNQRIINQADPTAAQDSATKAYVDSVAAGLNAKGSVRLKVNSVTGSFTAGAWVSVGTTLDGITMVAGDRVLVDSAFASGANSGIFVWSAAAGGTLTRPTDMDVWAEIPGAFTFVEQGTYADTGWVSTADRGGTLNTTPITWTQFSSPGSYTGGAGLTLTGLDFSVNVDNLSTEVAADVVRVKDLGITAAKLAVAAVDLAGTKVTGILPIANGGTGANNAANARFALGSTTGELRTVNGALVAGTYSSGFSFSNITTFHQIEVRDAVTFEIVDIDTKTLGAPGAQFVALRADVAVPANTLVIYAIGT